MADNPYTVLGVSKQASDEAVRKAFRKLAKELHPDVNKDNPAAAERFKMVSQAYDILGDAEKRAQFDRGEIDADGERRRTYTHAGGAYPGGGAAGPGGPFSGGYRGRPRSPVDDMGFGDIFSDIFGNTTAGGAGAAGGGFGGAGTRGGGPFSAGGGRTSSFATRGQDVTYALEIDFLEAVRGARKRVTLPSGSALDLNVPVGVADGKSLRLRGKGQPGGNGGPSRVNVACGRTVISMSASPVGPPF
ncbi:MAG: DnaJ domain-containing protein, partial [Pseudomonadota bacterium]